MSILTEFKEFAVKGNVIDMAVGVVIGGAFGKIVSSMVNDIVMPIVGQLTGGVDFSNLYIDLSGKGHATLDAARTAGAATINYGLFLNTVIDFVIIAAAIFMAIRQINRLKKPAAAATPTTRACDECKMEIPLAARRCGHCTSVVKA